MDSEKYEKIVLETEEKAKKEIEKKYSQDMLGYINIFEKEKKRILKKEYGIDWLTSMERFSGTCMD